MTDWLRRVAIPAAALVAMLAVTAVAAGALKTKSTTITLVPDGNEQSATATCKRGLKAVSGGFDAPGFAADGNGGYQIPISSLRESKREWTGSAVDDSGGGNYIVSASCSDDLPKLKQVSATATVDSGEVGSATANCPRPGEVVSGGFVPEVEEAGNNLFVFVFTSMRSAKRSWTVSGFNNSGDPLALTAYAYCAKEKVRLKTKSSTTSTNGDNINVSATAKCKKGRRAVSGGFAGNADGETDPFAQPFESQRTGKRTWETSAGAYTTDDQLDWQAFAYCLKKEKTG